MEEYFKLARSGAIKRVRHEHQWRRVREKAESIIPMLQSEDRPFSARSQSDIPAPTSYPQPSDSVCRETAQTRTTDETCMSESDKSRTEVISKPANNKLSLAEEIRHPKGAGLCKVCMECEVSVVFLPCGHLITCSYCGVAVDVCPLCHVSVRALVRASLA